MEGIRFIVCGDLHFRSENPRNRKDVFEDAMLAKLLEVFQLAKEHQATAIIIPGDIFDTANVGLKTIAKLGFCLNTWVDEYNTQVLVVSGNHDLPAGNKAALERTPFGLLSKFGFLWDLEDENFEMHYNFNQEEGFDYISISGCGFDFQTDTPEGQEQFYVDRFDEDTLSIHVVHSMLLASAPSFPMRHTLIDQVETDADIIISGHDHTGFGVIRRISMCRFRPNNRLTVTPGNQEKPLPDSWRSVVTGPEFPEFNLVSLTLQSIDKSVKGAALLVRVGVAVFEQRPPRFEFLDVLEHNHSWPNRCGPSHCYPCEPTDTFFDWLATFGLAEVFTVRAQPAQCNRAAVYGLSRVYIPDRLTIMLCRRVIDHVHGDGRWVVVDSYVHGPTYGQFDAGRCSAATCKIIDDDF